MVAWLIRLVDGIETNAVLLASSKMYCHGRHIFSLFLLDRAKPNDLPWSSDTKSSSIFIIMKDLVTAKLRTLCLFSSD